MEGFESRLGVKLDIICLGVGNYNSFLSGRFGVKGRVLGRLG